MGQRVEYKKMRDRRVGLACLQRNIRKYFGMKNWTWWKLYVQVLPMLTVAAAEADMKAQEEALKAAQEKAEALRRRKTLSAQPQGSISKDRCGSEELGENTDRFGTTHKDFPPTQSERRPEFAPQVDFFDKKSIRDDLRTDSRYIMYLYVYIKLYFWKYISYCEKETVKKKKKKKS